MNCYATDFLTHCILSAGIYASTQATAGVQQRLCDRGATYYRYSYLIYLLIYFATAIRGHHMVQV